MRGTRRRLAVVVAALSTAGGLIVPIAPAQAVPATSLTILRRAATTDFSLSYVTVFPVAFTTANGTWPTLRYRTYDTLDNPISTGTGVVTSVVGTTGRGYFYLTPNDLVLPRVRVEAWADDSTTGWIGGPDATEQQDVAFVAHADNGVVPAGTVLHFATPVASVLPTSSSHTLTFAAFNADGSPFTGVVRWGTSFGPTLPPAPLPSTYAWVFSADGTGQITLQFSITTLTPVQVFAYAEDPTHGNPSIQEPEEVTGQAFLVRPTAI